MRRSTRIAPFALDLHVLGTPPAFVLSQDQTLQYLNIEKFELDQSRTLASYNSCVCSELSFCSRRNVKKAHKELTAVSAVLLGLAIQFSKSELLLFPRRQFPAGRAVYSGFDFAVKVLFRTFFSDLPQPKQRPDATSTTSNPDRRPRPTAAREAAYTDLIGPCQHSDYIYFFPSKIMMLVCVLGFCSNRADQK